MTFDELWGRSTPNSWARVPRGPAAVAVGAFLFGSSGVLAATTIAGVSLATIGGFLITTAVTSWALSALAPKPPGTSSQTLGNVKEAVGDFDIVYGEARKGGTVTFMETSDRMGYKRFKDDYLHMIIVLAGHEVAEIGDVYFNDEKVTINAEGFVTGERWKSLARVKKHLGSPNQLADPDLVAETSVDSNFRGRGIAYLYVRLDWDKDVFANGTPIITAMVKGRKVYDPRSGNTAWTDNAALCIRDYLAQPFGLNSIESPSSLGSSDWVAAANVSDTLVNKKNSSSEKRFTINGVVSTANTPRTNLQNMLTSCGGTLFWGQGQWQFKAGYFPSGPYVSFNADDLRSGISLVTKNSRKENFNAVTGTFLDKTQGYIEVDYPKIESTVFLQRDNNQTNTLDMSLPYTTSSSAAQRLAKMAMFRSREEIIISADFGLKAARVKVGDVVQFTFDRYGFDDKYFEVVSWKPPTDGGELKINLILRETSAAAYDWNAEEKDILSNNTNLPDPTSGLSITNLSVTNRQTLQSDGSLLGEVVLAWDAADSAFIDKYVVQWKKATDISWSATETDEISIVIPSVKSGVLHDYRVKAVNFAGFSGPWEQLTTIVDGKQVPPGIPTNLQTKNSYRAVEVSWVNPTDRDLNHVEIWGGATSNVSNATLLGKSGGTKFIFSMEPMEEKWFFVRAVDNSDNKSPFTTGKKGTALFIEQSDVDIDVDQLLDDAGLSAVEVLPNLPTAGNFDGRTVYNTDDRQLYIYDSATRTWKPAVEPFDPNDLILDKDNFPSDLKPVEVLPSLPTTGNYEGRVVMLLSDGKLYRYKSGAFTAAVPTTDLTGTINTDQIANNAISTAKFATGLRPVEVVSTLPTTGNVNGRTVVLTTDGKLYRYHSGSWTASVPTADLVGDIQSSQIAAVAASKVTGQLTNSQIADIAAAKLTGQVTGAQIANSAISAIKLADNAVTAVKISNGAVESSKIATGAVTGDKILDNAVTETKILDDSISTPKIATNAITSDKIVANAVTTAKIDALAITAGKIATGAIVSDKIQAGAVGAGQIAANAIVASKIDSGAVTTAKIAAGAVIADKIATNAITAGKIEAGAVTTAKVDAGAITATKIASGAIIADKIASSAITTDKLDANAVTTAKISAGAVKADQIAANAIVAGKLAVANLENLFDGFDNQATSPFEPSGWGGSWGTTQWNGQNGIEILSGTNGYTMREFPVTPGSEYHIGFYGARNSAWDGTAGGSKLRIADQTNALKATIPYDASLPHFSTPWEYRSINFVVPSGMTKMNISLTNNGTAGRVNLSGMVMRLRNGGELIVDGAITANKVSANAVTADKIEANAVTVGKISAGAVATDKIASNAITTVKIAAEAVKADKIASNSVNTSHLVANAVTAGIIAAGAVSAAAIQSGAVTADKINVNSLSAISANLGTIEVGTANIAIGAINSARILDGAISSAKIGNVIQSTNFVTGPSGTGWRIQKDGVAEFNNVIIRRTIQAASGTVNVGTITPKTQYAVGLGNGTTGIATGSSVNILNGPGNVIEVLTTPIAIDEWQGTSKTYIATVGMTGTVNSSNTDDCYWGWDAQVLPLTKWSGNQTLRLRLSFWSKAVNTVSNCVLTWKIYEVS